MSLPPPLGMNDAFRELQSKYQQKDKWIRKPGLATIARIVCVAGTRVAGYPCLQETERATLQDERKIRGTLQAKAVEAVRELNAVDGRE